MGVEQTAVFWPEWKIESQIGEGSYGKVYKAIREDHGIKTYSAIKVISVPSTQGELEALRSEGMS